MTSSSSWEEKTRKTLEALGIRDAEAVGNLFAEIEVELNTERTRFGEAAYGNPAERDAALKNLRDRWHSRKKGLIAAMDANWLKAAPRELKPAVGKAFNAFRKAAVSIEAAELRKALGDLASSIDPSLMTPDSGYEAIKAHDTHRKHRQFQVAAAAGLSAANPILPPDPTLPGTERPIGSLHPITRVQREIEDIFLGLGYTIETGPEIESVYYNFEALNIPENHPSRDDQDTIYVDSKTVLRTHTSPVQIRAMEKYKEPPLYIVIPGKVYRRDNPDATHSPMFHQVEGLAIDKDITFADLKGILDYFGKRLFGKNVRSSFHPSFFPFTEPSAEVAFSCVFCDGKGCRVCKESGWVEMLGCGMVHPEVLRAGGFDPAKYTGWAFGMGIERLAMFKYGIHDIQMFYQSDVRFLEQFP